MAIDFTKLRQKELDVLGKDVKTSFTSNELLRNTKTLELLESLRQVEMEYDPEALARLSEEESKMYSGYTRSKYFPLGALLSKHLFPEKEKNWDVLPTPIPNVSQKTLDYVVNMLCRELSKKNAIIQPPQPPVTPDMLSPEIIESDMRSLTSARAENMKTTIADQLHEDSYIEKQRAALWCGLKYGTGIIKGALSEPYQSTQIEKIIVKGEVNPIIDKLPNIVKNAVLNRYPPKDTIKWVQKTKDVYRPSSELVPIWNFFPDMSAVELKDCSFVDTLKSITKHDLRKLAERPDFFGDVITKFIPENPNGNYKLREWERTARTTGTHNTNTTPAFLKNQGYTANSPSGGDSSPNYEVIERDMHIDGHELFKMGIEDIGKSAKIDIDKSYFCNIWILDNKVIKIALWDERLYTCLEDIYHIFYHEKDETSILGKGLPKIARYTELALSATDRNMLNNAAYIARPCGEVNVNGLTAAQAKEAGTVPPGKFFVGDKRGQDANQRFLHVYDIASHVQEFIAIKNELRMQGDLVTCLPSYLFGGQANQDISVSTTKMQFNAMVDYVKNLVSSFDKMHKSCLQSFYKWNMIYNPDEDIKGDMRIQTIGSTAAIINEAKVQQWGFLLQSMSDEAKDRVNWDEWLKMIGRHMELPEYEKIVLSEDKYQEKVMQRQQEQERQMMMQETLAQAKAGKDMATTDKTKAATAKIIGELPHHIASKEIDNESKQVDNMGKVVDMQHKKSQIKTAEVDDLLKVAGAIKGNNEPRQTTQ